MVQACTRPSSELMLLMIRCSSLIRTRPLRIILHLPRLLMKPISATPQQATLGKLLQISRLTLYPNQLDRLTSNTLLQSP